MAIIKCKMCGGDLKIIDGATTAECEFCGSVQTLPRVSDERLASFYERANDLRMCHEFDKAEEIYEKIIEENSTDADAYWSMVLCRYGVDYVEENRSGIRKPTINRAQLVSVFEDVNYRTAIKYADEEQRRVYEQEAAKIDRILQRYLEISRNEQPYDVFICYKETGSGGERTEDSVHAGEIYRELTAEGFKVFFAPVTLESKLGEDYEPYIFAAINSAKVMIVIGTKPEYFNAVWVKNEWSRFLTLAKTDTKKTLIPVYGKMRAYDMPEAFRFKQSQNLEKLGFMLDLVRGVEKLVGKGVGEQVPQPAAQVQSSPATAGVDTLLQRVTIFLEDKEWENAGIYCEKVLDIAPTNGKAYLYKLLVEAKVTKESALQNMATPLENLKTYRNAVRYADEATSAKLIGWNQAIKDRIEQVELARREQERIRKKQEERRNRFEQKKWELTSAITKESTKIQELTDRRNNLTALLDSSKNEAEKSIKNALIVKIFAILTIICDITVYAVNGISDAAGVFLIIVCIFAAVSAGARGKSKLAAGLLSFFTAGIFAFFSAGKGLIETSKISATKIRSEQENCQTEIQQLNSDITISENRLQGLRDELKAFEANA